MNKVVKNVLTAVGAVAVTVKAPVLVAGLVAGAVLTNPEKAKKTAMDGLDKTMGWMEDLLVKSGVPEEDLERVKEDVLGKEPETVEDLFSEDEDVPEEEVPDHATSEEEVNVEADVADDDEDDLTPTEAGNWSAT